jgi:hypothetical protein
MNNTQKDLWCEAHLEDEYGVPAYWYSEIKTRH